MTNLTKLENTSTLFTDKNGAKVELEDWKDPSKTTMVSPEWYAEVLEVEGDTVTLDIYEEYTDGLFPADNLPLLEDILTSLAGEKVTISSYSVEGKTLTAVVK